METDKDMNIISQTLPPNEVVILYLFCKRYNGFEYVPMCDRKELRTIIRDVVNSNHFKDLKDRHKDNEVYETIFDTIEYGKDGPWYCDYILAKLPQFYGGDQVFKSLCSVTNESGVFFDAEPGSPNKTPPIYYKLPTQSN